jgi:hypothetical protein
MDATVQMKIDEVLAELLETPKHYTARRDALTRKIARLVQMLETVEDNEIAELSEAG